jgi:hypothetical protein
MPDIVRIDRLKIFLDSMGGGAWPFLVGGVICLVIWNIARKRGILSMWENDCLVDRLNVLGQVSICRSTSFKSIFLIRRRRLHNLDRGRPSLM